MGARRLHEPNVRVSLIGAGISGLVCARTLLDQGVLVTIFEKSRGVGGRMATRRTAEGFRFDHGAQYFTVRDERFERYVKAWMQDGIVARWEGRIGTLINGNLQQKQKTTPRYVGVPAMNSICRHLAADLNVEFDTRVAPPELHEGLWRVSDEQGQPMGEFDCVITSAPAPQSAELLVAAPHMQQMAQAITMTGCWAVMVAFDHSLGLPCDGAFVHESPLSWISRNDTKPDRASQPECWVLHASPEWSSQWLERQPHEVLPQLIDAFWQATGVAPRAPCFAASHRWRYAISPEPLENRSLFDSQLGLGACGDWCSGPRVEGAFLSGIVMADKVLSHIAARR